MRGFDVTCLIEREGVFTLCLCERSHGRCSVFLDASKAESDSVATRASHARSLHVTPAQLEPRVLLGEHRVGHVAHDGPHVPQLARATERPEEHEARGGLWTSKWTSAARAPTLGGRDTRAQEARLGPPAGPASLPLG